jgi:hypothetical protein
MISYGAGLRRVMDPGTVGRVRMHQHVVQCLACRPSTEARTIEERHRRAGCVAHAISREGLDAGRRVGTDLPSGCLGRSRMPAHRSMACDRSASTVETLPTVLTLIIIYMI